MKISQDTQFTSDTLKGANNKLYALLNKREQTDDDENIQYLADGYDITGQADPKLFLHQQVSDPLFFKFKRGEADEQEWLDAIQTIKNLNV